MNQEGIWDHFQNEGLDHFAPAMPRLEFLAKRLRPKERVLNIGVGSGALEEIALARNVEMWSLDPSERAINRLRERLQLGTRAQSGYSQAMPFPSNHFDVVIMSEVLEHLDEEIRSKTLEEVFRVLRPGGRFIGTVPAREQLALAEVVCPNCNHHFHRWGHQASFDVDALGATLQQTFQVENVSEHFFTAWDSASWTRRLGGVLKKFLSWRGIGTYGTSRNIYFSARKRRY